MECKRCYMGFHVFTISLILILSFSLPEEAKAEGASLYFSPGSGTFFVGSTFEVSVFINTGGENINAVEVNLIFDPSKIQIANPTAGKSFIQVWISQPTFSNTKGTASFMGGVPTPGINTSAGLISTITFRAIAPGETSILFATSSKILRNDPNGTNILTSRGRGVYTILIPPPEGPEIFSPTHPDQNKWYKNNNPSFSWEKEEGVTDFSYNFDQDPVGAPDNVSEGNHTSVSFNDVRDGIWYFHLKAEKSNVWGGISHYLVRLDKTPPAAFKIAVEPSAKTVERQPMVSFMTTDALSGIDYYHLKYIDISEEKTEEVVGFFSEITSPYKLPGLGIGKYLVIVRAYDVAGNFREGTTEIKILSKKILFTKEGIRFRDMFLPWWLLILILIIILIVIGLRLKQKHKKTLKKKREEVKKMGEKIKFHQEKIKDIVERANL